MERKDKQQRMLNFNPPWTSPAHNAGPDTSERARAVPKAPRIQGRLDWLVRWDNDQRRFIPMDCQLLVARITKSCHCYYIRIGGVIMGGLREDNSENAL